MSCDQQAPPGRYLAGLSLTAFPAVAALTPPGSRPAGPIHLWLRAHRRGLIVMVWDANPQPPIRKEAGDDAVSGRGLMIVEALSSRWGWYKPQDTGGKRVWCEIDRQPAF
jgi:hypothetical protein